MTSDRSTPPPAMAFRSRRRTGPRMPRFAAAACLIAEGRLAFGTSAAISG